MAHTVELDWKVDTTWGFDRHMATSPFHGFLDGYVIFQNNDGVFVVEGLRGNAARAKTLDEAKAIAANDLLRRARAAAWQRYMEENDPPS